MYPLDKYMKSNVSHIFCKLIIAGNISNYHSENNLQIKYLSVLRNYII